MGNTSGQSKNLVRITLDLRIVVVALLAVIGIMLALWQPWSNNSSDRTLEVTGESTIKAEPDEFVFYPTFSFKNSDPAAALAELSKKSDEIVSKLKGLGVTESNIKTNANHFENGTYFPEQALETSSLQLTVTVTEKELAQKVQDYLVTTAPEGSATPQLNFSSAKKKQLETEGRDEATKSARTKADQSAKNLGFKIGKVKSVTDGAEFGAYPLIDRITGAASDSGASTASSLTLQPGLNEITYRVTVVYYVR
jgi:uncharacterized protein